MASREESAIIGFNRAEQARLLYAWQLVLTYRRNFERLSRWDLALSSITIICAMITTCTGLVAYADPAYFRGRGDVVAGLLSIVTGFLLGAQRYFEFGTKAAACEPVWKSNIGRPMPSRPNLTHWLISTQVRAGGE